MTTIAITDNLAVVADANDAEGMVIKGPRKREELNIKILDIPKQLSRKINYLGFKLDEKYSTKKAGAKFNAMARIMSNIGSPGSLKGKALYGVMKSILLYATPVWKSAIAGRYSIYSS